MVLRDHVANEKVFISTTAMTEASELGSLMTYVERFPPLKSYEYLNKWLREVT